MADLRYGLTRTPWGRLQIVVNGQDVTFFRDAPIEVHDSSSGDPFGDLTLTLFLPQVFVHETPGEGDLAWLGTVDAPPDVTIYHVDPDDNQGEPLWEGLVEDYAYSNGGLRLVCIGAMLQLDDYTRLPLYPEEPVPFAQLFALQFQQSSRPALRLEELIVEGDPPFETMRTGSGQNTLTGFLQDLLSVAFDEDTHDKWTLALDRPRQPVLRVKDLDTVHHTMDARAITAGQNVGISLTSSPGEKVIYGEGQDQAGITWRRQRDDTLNVSYDPVASDPRTRPDEPEFDSRVRRLERTINFGQNVSEFQAVDVAAEIITRNLTETWSGSLTMPLPYLLTEGDIPRGGQNLELTSFRGGTILLHIVTCRINWQNATVSLQVDTQGRDYLTLVEVLKRNAAEQSDPGYRLQRGANSAVIEDRKLPWMSSSGFIPIGSFDRDVPGGVIDGTFRPEGPIASPTDEPDAYVHCPANEWTLIEFRGATLMTLKKIKFGLYDAGGNLTPVPFYMSLLDTNDVTIGIPEEPDRDTVYLPTDPDGESIPWNHPKSAPNGALETFGVAGQRCGFSSVPGRRHGNPPEDEGGDPTGLYIDESPLSYELPEGSRACWLAVFPVGGDGFGRGQFERGVE